MAASYGSFAQLEINDVQYDFLPSSMIGVHEEHVDANGLRGTLQHAIERNLAGIKRINGEIKMYPNPTELTTLLPICLGTAVSTITYALAESLTGYTYVVDRKAKCHTYAAALVDTIRFHSAQNQPLGMDLGVVGTTDESEGAAGSFTSTGINVATKPWMHSMMTLTSGGTTVTPQSFECAINWNIDKDRFFNSQTLSTGTNATDLGITLRAMLPYGDSTSQYTSNSVSTGVAVVATWTNGVYILTMTFAKVAWRKESPEINSRGEIMLPLSGVAMRSSSTAPLVTTLAIS